MVVCGAHIKWEGSTNSWIHASGGPTRDRVILRNEMKPLLLLLCCIRERERERWLEFSYYFLCVQANHIDHLVRWNPYTSIITFSLSKNIFLSPCLKILFIFSKKKIFILLSLSFSWVCFIYLDGWLIFLTLHDYLASLGFNLTHISLFFL